MIVVYRLSAAQWAGDLTGEGARLSGGRWNERATPALYAAHSVSLAMLEILVHVGDVVDLPTAYTVTVIQIEGEINQAFDHLPRTKEESQQMGQALLLDLNVLGFWMPSAVVPTERNLILNPRCHQYAQRVKVKETYVFQVDPRLGA